MRKQASPESVPDPLQMLLPLLAIQSRAGRYFHPYFPGSENKSDLAEITHNFNPFLGTPKQNVCTNLCDSVRVQ